MATKTVKLRPGIDIQMTPILNELGWSDSQSIRFFEGLPQKVGGWTLFLPEILISGVYVRAIHTWANLLSQPQIAFGCDNGLIALNGKGFLSLQSAPSPIFTQGTATFSVTSGSPTVTVTDNGISGGPVVSPGDVVNFPVPITLATAFGSPTTDSGITLYGHYTVVTASYPSYTITATSNSAANLTNIKGLTPLFNTTNGSATVYVNTHLVNGEYGTATFPVSFAVSIGGIIINPGFYGIVSTDANGLYIIPASAATSTQSVFENTGQVPISYAQSYPYDIGPPLWFLDNWGQQLIGNYSTGPVQILDATWGPGPGNAFRVINTSNFPGAIQPPVSVLSTLVAAPLQIVIAFGANPIGSTAIDPNLVRWSDVGDYTDWQASATNQAGSFRIPSGSQIIGAVVSGNYIYLWTDVDMWVMQYIGFPLVFSFNKIANGVELLSPKAAGVFQSSVFWVSNDDFYVFDGNGVRRLNCPVWDFFFTNVSRSLSYKTFVAVNSYFSEITWHFPSNFVPNGECDFSVTYSVRENVWWFNGSSQMARTAWTDEGVFGPPIGSDVSSNILQHEVGNDAAGVPIISAIISGYMTLDEGNFFTSIKRLIPDMILTGGTEPNNRIFITLILLDYPNGPPTMIGPFAWTPQAPEFILSKCRGRLVSIRISSEDAGVFWRLGALRYEATQSGRR